MKRFDKFSGERFAAVPGINRHMDDANGRCMRCNCLMQFRLGDGRLGPHAGLSRRVKVSSNQRFRFASDKLVRARMRAKG